LQNQISSTLQILIAKFNGQILIPFAHAVESAGYQQQTARNLMSKKEFPIPSVLNGSRRFIHVEDLANYIESLRSPPPKKLGRPTKASKLQAKNGGSA
jgi:hypothetical protein